MTLIFCYLYLFLIKYILGYIIWGCLFISMSILLGSGFYTYFHARPQYDELNPTYQYLEYASYGLWAVTGIYAIGVLCCCDAIRVGIKVVRTTARYVQNNMSIMLLPLVLSFIQMIWFLIWLLAAVYIASIGTPEPREMYPFITEVKWSDETRYVLIYHLFGLLWVNAFVIGCCQFIIGCSACLWYFEVSGPSQGKGTVRRATFWLFRYHLGSIAFGSCLIAICQMIRLIFEYYRKKMSRLEKTSGIVKAIMCLTRYLLWLLE